MTASPTGHQLVHQVGRRAGLVLAHEAGPINLHRAVADRSVLPISLEVIPSSSRAATSRSRAVSSALTGRAR